MPRRLLVSLVLLLLLVLAAALLVPLLLDKEKVLQLASTALREKTGATLAVNGDARITILPALGISLSDAAITLPQQEQPDLYVNALQIGVQLLPLFRGRIEMDNVALKGVKARLGVTRTTTESAAAPGAAGVASTVTAPLALHVKRLTIADAQLELVDPRQGTLIEVELVELEAKDLNPAGNPIAVDMKLRLPGREAAEMRIDGNIQFEQRKQSVTLNQLEAAVSGILPNPLIVRTSGAIDLARQSADLQVALELGETRGEGTVRYARTGNPRVETVLQFNQWDPALLALAAPEGAAAANNDNKQSTATKGDEQLPLQALRAIDARTDLKITTARFGAHTVKNLHVKLRALDGIVQVTELTGDLHGGKLSAGATFDGTDDSATLETSGILRQLDIATALAAAQATPALTGGATLEWQMSSQGMTRNELIATLHGPVKVTTKDVVLQGMSIEKMLCQAMALTNREPLTATFPANTRFAALAADINVADGRAILYPMRGEVTGIALDGSGNLDLLQKNFSATFEAHLSPELEQVDPACRISKRLVALDLPINCAGSVGTEPSTWCRVDAAKALQDLTANETREKLEKKASKLLDKLFNKKD